MQHQCRNYAPWGFQGETCVLSCVPKRVNYSQPNGMAAFREGIEKFLGTLKFVCVVCLSVCLSVCLCMFCTSTNHWLNTWEVPKVLNTTTGQPANMKSKVLKLVKCFKQNGSAITKLSRIWGTCCRPLLAFAVYVYLDAVEENSAIQGEIFTVV